MEILIVALIIAGILLAGFLSDSLPKQYLQRVCQGFAWRRQFPDASKESIRAFLKLFTSAFAFKEKYILKFGPKDEVLHIYRALYPSRNTPDALEIETLSLNLERAYGLKLQEMWHEHITLGELFSVSVSPNNSFQG